MATQTALKALQAQPPAMDVLAAAQRLYKWAVQNPLIFKGSDMLAILRFIDELQTRELGD